MQYTQIPETDLRTSNICLGTAFFGTAIENRVSFKLLDTFFSEGGNFMDSARVYGDWYRKELGISERLIGQWMMKRKNRSYLVLSTKGGHPDPWSIHKSRLSPKEIISDIEKSLIAFGTDYIDLYWLHRDDKNCSVSEVIDILVDQAKAGKIRYFGCSNWKLDRIIEAKKYTSFRKINGFVANQMMWSLAVINNKRLSDNNISMNNNLKQYHIKTGLAAIPYTSQAKGIFQKMQKGILNKENNGLKSIYHNHANVLLFQRIQNLVTERSLSVTGITLGYLRSQPFTTIPIIGSRNTQQLLDSIKGGDVKLTEEEIKYLENG